MSKTNINLINRVLELYKVLPRAPKSALTIEEFKEKVRHYYCLLYTSDAADD